MNEKNNSKNTESSKNIIVEELKKLALQLKSVCNSKGIETDPIKSAEIIHKLALVFFRQCSNKISLIQSIGLLNSAIARYPTNMSVIIRDLSIACQFVLQQAEAQDLTVDLIKKASEVSKEIESMRNQANKTLKFLQTVQKLEELNNTKLRAQRKNKIKFVNKLQLQIAKNYTKIMKDLYQYCEHLMGPAPCKFAVVGMGSLARKEITPYSDFEHIVLLENSTCDEDCLKYFRWYSIVCHVIVLNLQETIIPSLNIEYLNDKTGDLGDWYFDTYTSGVSFDGMMVHACKFPLGRTQPTKNKPWTTELIKPVEKMLEYLSDDVSLKNGYHLSDILTETCFVYGDQTLHKAFEKGIESYKNSKTNDELLDEIRKQVKDDLNNYATRTKLVNLKPSDKLNVKQLFYRTSTLFITALGKIYGMKSSSCFDIINELAEKKKISKYTKYKLSYAVAIACEIRLSVYMKAQSQCDYIQRHKNSETIFDEILTTIDKQSIVSYFQIAYCLQLEIIKKLGIKGTFTYSNFTLMNITICYALRLDAPIIAMLEDDPSVVIDSGSDSGLNSDSELNSDSDLNSNSDLQSDSDQENFVEKNKFFSHFDKHLASMEYEIKICASTKNSSPPDTSSIFSVLFDAAFNEDFENIQNQIEMLMRSMEILQRSSLSNEDRKKILKPNSEDEDMDIDLFAVFVNMTIANLLIALNKFNKAIMHMNRAFESIDEAKCNHVAIVKFHLHAGNNWIGMKEYEKSLICWRKALEICLSIGLEQFEGIDDSTVALMYAGTGICLLKLGQYQESLIYLENAVQTFQDYSLENFYLSSEILMFIDLSSLFHSLGKGLTHLGQFEKAMSCFLQALECTESEHVLKENDEILTQTTKTAILEIRQLKLRASVFHNLGMLLMKQKKFEKAVINFEESFNISKKLSDVKYVNKTRVKLLQCYMEMYQREKFN